MNSKEIEKLEDEKAKMAWQLVDATILLNLYATENVIFGHIKNGEKVPFERYITDLKLQQLAPNLDFEITEGTIINKGIIDFNDFEELIYQVYSDKVNYIFDNAPIAKEFESEEDQIFHYRNGLYEYLKNLYFMFREIIFTKVNPDLFTAVPDIIEEDTQRIYYLKITKFINAIKLKKLRQGSCVNRYIKNLPFMSPFIKRLLKIHKGRYILKNSDTNSTDYKIALFSCFRFYNAYNTKLFELKMLQWEELNLKSQNT